MTGDRWRLRYFRISLEKKLPFLLPNMQNLNKMSAESLAMP